MKKTTFAIFLIILLTSYNKAFAGKFVIEGNIKNIPDSTVIAMRSSINREYVLRDTLINGHFRFQDTAVGDIDSIPVRWQLYGEGDEITGVCIVWVCNNTTKITGESNISVRWNIESDLQEQKDENIFIKASIDDIYLLHLEYTKREVFMKELKALPEDDTVKSKEIWAKIRPVDSVIDNINERIRINDIKIMQNMDINDVWLNHLYDLANAVTEIWRVSKYPDLLEPAKELYARLNDEQKLTKTGRNITKLLYPIKAGDKMIDAALSDFEGKKYNLSEFTGKGKYILLDFWGSGCAPCVQALPELQSIEVDYANTLKIIGIAFDSKESFEKIAKAKNITSLNLQGTNDVWEKYGLSGIPYYVLVSTDGIILEAGYGYGKGTLIKMLEQNNIKK